MDDTEFFPFSLLSIASTSNLVMKKNRLFDHTSWLATSSKKVKFARLAIYMGSSVTNSTAGIGAWNLVHQKIGNKLENLLVCLVHNSKASMRCSRTSFWATVMDGTWLLYDSKPQTRLLQQHYLCYNRSHCG